MIDSKLVSVIITTHNRLPSIVLRAVNSVLNQTYGYIEIIVVDDSTYNYPYRAEVEKKIREASQGIIFIKHDECMGACAARNTGLSYSKGNYVAFLDDDDEWLPEKIEKQIKGFTDSKIALVYCGFWIIGENNEKNIAQMTYMEGYVFPALLKHDFTGITTSNPLIKKECLEEVGAFDVKMQSLQDYDMLLRIARKYPVSFIEQPLLICYCQDQNRISEDVDKQILGRKYIIAKYHKEIVLNKTAWYMNHRHLVILYVKKGWRKKAILLWTECVRKRPLNIIGNMELLIFIASGCDSLLYRLYKKNKAFQ